MHDCIAMRPIRDSPFSSAECLGIPNSSLHFELQIQSRIVDIIVSREVLSFMRSLLENQVRLSTNPPDIKIIRSRGKEKL
jgi:hypothetical protein